MNVRKSVLCVLDGWGYSPSSLGNAIGQAATPNFDALLRDHPNALLAASGMAVGLPEGQQGNSEVGHLTIGAGRVVLQDLTRIDAAIADGSFFDNQVLTAAVDLARARGTRLHLLGLISPGGVHSHQKHLLALCEMARRRGLERVAVHAFTDGRDTPPSSGAGFLEWLNERLSAIGVGRVVSVSGRYYAMDRDRRWDRLERAFRTLQGRPELRRADAVQYLEESYAGGTTDEFILPASIAAEGDEVVGIAAGDVVIHFNFRPDRGRELCHALADANFDEFDRGDLPHDLDLVTFTDFDDLLPVEVAFPKPLVANTLGEVVATAGLRQFHVAETEKYAHVTYFVNGGREEPFPGEERLLVPSSNVATYDLQPEMSAAGITDAVVDRLQRGEDALIVVNYANADMVGHTGNLAATVAAVEFLDHCVGRVVGAAETAGYRLLLTADHGNAEEMIDVDTDGPVTSHTSNPVPVVITGESCRLRDGGLRDVAPTLLGAMGLTVPAEMTGADLRVVA
ncbi:MAG: 2,3-bisphosphoglycerate-independent phosphoglycerate mutase [Candidatus Dormibacteria bacterium]